MGKERKEKGGIKKVIWRVGLEKELKKNEIDVKKERKSKHMYKKEIINERGNIGERESERYKKRDKNITNED